MKTLGIVGSPPRQASVRDPRTGAYYTRQVFVSTYSETSEKILQEVYQMFYDYDPKRKQERKTFIIGADLLRKLTYANEFNSYLFMDIGGMSSRLLSRDHVLRTDSFALSDVKKLSAVYNNLAPSARIATRIESKNGLHRLIIEKKKQKEYLKLVSDVRPYMYYKLLNEKGIPVQNEEIQWDLENSFTNFDF